MTTDRLTKIQPVFAFFIDINIKKIYNIIQKAINLMGENMKIVYSKDSLKFLARMEKSIVNNIKEAIQGLTLDPPQGDIKTMQGYKDGRKRLRIGKYRVIYRYDDDGTMKILFIIDIGSRGGIYK